MTISTLRSVLQAFTTSPSNFHIVHSIPSKPLTSHLAPIPKTLYILDSSFNPPTRAHFRIATSALLNDKATNSKRLLLLLATQNADKAPKPASFEHRLTMMTYLAEDVEECLKSQGIPMTVDIGVTKLPYFHDKSAAIAAPQSDYFRESLGLSQESSEKQCQQVHLFGFDTLVRLMDPKYYPPEHTLDPLEPLFADHRLRVTYRADDRWGAKPEQEKWLWRLAAGEMEDVGGKKEWADRIEMVEGRREGDEVISSTKVREVVQKGDGEGLEKLVTRRVAEWILRQGLYTETQS